MPFEPLDPSTSWAGGEETPSSPILHSIGIVLFEDGGVEFLPRVQIGEQEFVTDATKGKDLLLAELVLRAAIRNLDHNTIIVSLARALQQS